MELSGSKAKKEKNASCNAQSKILMRVSDSTPRSKPGVHLLDLNTQHLYIQQERKDKPRKGSSPRKMGKSIEGMTQRDATGREVGGGFRMGNTCTPVADSDDVWQNQYNIVK